MKNEWNLKPCDPPTECGTYWWIESLTPTSGGPYILALRVGVPPCDFPRMPEDWSKAPILAAAFWRDYKDGLRTCMSNTGMRVCDIGGVWLGRILDPHEAVIAALPKPVTPKAKK